MVKRERPFRLSTESWTVFSMPALMLILMYTHIRRRIDLNLINMQLHLIWRDRKTDHPIMNTRTRTHTCTYTGYDSYKLQM